MKGRGTNSTPVKARSTKASKPKVFRFRSVLERSENRLWQAHLRVPPDIADQLSEGNSRRVLCGLNTLPERQCAILHRGKGIFLITVNKSLRQELGLDFGMEAEVRLRKDSSTYGLPFPEELRELLRQDREGDSLFHSLTPGKQRTLLHIIGSAMRPDKRLFRAVAIVRHLKAHKGKINYRALATALANPIRSR